MEHMLYIRKHRTCSASNEIQNCNQNLQAIGDIVNVDPNVHMVTLKNCGLLQSIFPKLSIKILERLFCRSSANNCFQTSHKKPYYHFTCA